MQESKKKTNRKEAKKQLVAKKLPSCILIVKDKNLVSFSIGQDFF